MYHVSVDASRCQGHARCLAFAPDVFDFDDEGYAFVTEGQSSGTDLPENIRKASMNCPERAIRVEEE